MPPAKKDESFQRRFMPAKHVGGMGRMGAKKRDIINLLCRLFIEAHARICNPELLIILRVKIHEYISQ